VGHTNSGVKANKYDEMSVTCRKGDKVKKMVKMSLYIIKQHAVKTNVEVEVYVAPPLLTLDRDKRPAVRPGRFTPGEQPLCHSDEKFRSGACGVEKNVLSLLGIEPWPSNPLPVTILTDLPWFLRQMTK
jgi:hypothetical protein